MFMGGKKKQKWSQYIQVQHRDLVMLLNDFYSSFSIWMNRPISQKANISKYILEEGTTVHLL